jgi:mono/diheme cytochrome c family protein
MQTKFKGGVTSAAKWGRPRIILIALAVVLFAAAAGAAFGYVMTGRSDSPPSRPETVTAALLRRAFVPLHARKIEVPADPPASALLDGRRIYFQHCSLCHGGSGKADAALSKAFYPPVPDLTDALSRRWSDRELFWTIQNGVRLTGMPAWRSTLNDDQTWHVIAYVRRLSMRDQQAQARATNLGDSPAELRQLALDTIEDQGCRDCHRIGGEGATVGPNLSEEWARGRSDQWLLGHFRNPPAYTPGTQMPSFSNLSDRELKALVLFLQEPK